jgi:hypothetical protein
MKLNPDIAATGRRLLAIERALRLHAKSPVGSSHFRSFMRARMEAVLARERRRLAGLLAAEANFSSAGHSGPIAH